MINVRHSLDFLPKYEAAGVKTKYMNESTANCLQSRDLVTPEQMKRFRRSYKNQVGVTVSHYGKANDQSPPPILFGKKSPESSHVPEVFRDDALEGLQGYIRQLKEGRFSSNKKEPLGHTVDRGYNWPVETSNKHFSFGVSTISSEPAKDIIYSHPGMLDDEKIRQQYLKSHLHYEAGEQIHRGYKWPFPTENHVFGRSGQKIVGEAKRCLHPELADESFPKTMLVQKNQEDFKDFAYHSVGVSKNLGQTNKYTGPNHIHGYKPKDLYPSSTSQCIHGNVTWSQVAPDVDLGKSIKHGCRNITNVGDEKRSFGIPTIRNDIKKPLLTSVANLNNYGDEPQAVELLFPQRFHEMGVTRQDFEIPRPKDEIRKLFANIGYNYKAGKFEGIFAKAQELSGTYQDEVSINSFLEAMKAIEEIYLTNRQNQ